MTVERFRLRETIDEDTRGRIDFLLDFVGRFIQATKKRETKDTTKNLIPSSVGKLVTEPRAERGDAKVNSVPISV